MGSGSKVMLRNMPSDVLTRISSCFRLGGAKAGGKMAQSSPRSRGQTEAQVSVLRCVAWGVCP